LPAIFAAIKFNLILACIIAVIDVAARVRRQGQLLPGAGQAAQVPPRAGKGALGVLPIDT
jgi:hypothetical protein